MSVSLWNYNEQCEGRPCVGDCDLCEEKEENMRDCESCIYARPYGGENDNRCSAWSCEYINRQEAIEVYKAYEDIVQCNECKYWHEGEWYNTCDKHIGNGFPSDYFCGDGKRRSE